MTTETSARAEAERHAGELKDTVKEQGSRVTGTAADQTKEVAQDALDRAKSLGGELRTTVGRETGEQRDRLVGVIRDFASELDEMSSGSGQTGFAAQATSTVAEQVRRFADSIDGSTGQDLASSVRSFARRKPVTFLAGAAVAGIVVGRFVRGVQAGEPDSGRSGYRTGTGYGSTGYGSTEYGTSSEYGSSEYGSTGYAGSGSTTPATGARYGGGLSDTSGYGGTGSGFTGGYAAGAADDLTVGGTGSGEPLEGLPETDRELGEVRVTDAETAYRSGDRL